MIEPFRPSMCIRKVSVFEWILLLNWVRILHKVEFVLHKVEAVLHKVEVAEGVRKWWRSGVVAPVF